ncbi:MAG: type II toxin-antitoxin system VapC family toxin [Micropruina sp.]|uniref:type II toxin-antitoxin system VapC family toxin n=1 Tax=Micropruina sp. TaxID=2737536 RepID=UPI0039E6933A
MIVLDTNVISAVIGDHAEPRIVTWLDAVPELICLTSITAAELRLGAALLPAGRRRARLQEEIEAMLTEDFADAVLPFDEPASTAYAAVVAGRRSSGRPISVLDAQIAAICVSRGAALATRNVRDFDGTGVTVVDPWT